MMLKGEGTMAKNNHDNPPMEDISKIPLALEFCFNSEMILMPMNFERAYPNTWEVTNQTL